MNYLDAIILGLMQGLTEFLPISSSGHLVLTEHLLGVKMPGVSFELIVHLGTLFSVLVYFRKRIWTISKSVFIPSDMVNRKMIFYIIIATIPVVLIALLLKSQIEEAFQSPLITSFALLITGIILLLTALSDKGTRELKLPRALIIGLGQALAIFPGISRSGTSISAGLFAGVKPMVAAEFSFLLSIPAICGAIVFMISDLFAIDPALFGQYLTGAVVSFLSGLLAVYILLDFIRKGMFKYFGLYCLMIGTFGIIYFS
ncbi:MAG: undecaprenyl-diphosphate phosphatase [Candidatus Zixiibacteriota bacterium]